jgi:hypothetical protein
VLRSGPVSGSGSGSVRSRLLRVSAVGSAVDVVVGGGGRDGGQFRVGGKVGHRHRFHSSVQRISVNRKC